MQMLGKEQALGFVLKTVPCSYCQYESITRTVCFCWQSNGIRLIIEAILEDLYLCACYGPITRLYTQVCIWLCMHLLHVHMPHREDDACLQTFFFVWVSLSQNDISSLNTLRCSRLAINHTSSWSLELKRVDQSILEFLLHTVLDNSRAIWESDLNQTNLILTDVNVPSPR